MRGAALLAAAATAPPRAAGHGFIVTPASRNKLICNTAYPPNPAIQGKGEGNYVCLTDREHGGPGDTTPAGHDPGIVPLHYPVCAAALMKLDLSPPTNLSWSTEAVYAALQHPGPAQATWQAGSEVELTWQITANHGGYYSYRLCLDGSDTEECFQRTPLLGASGKQWFGPIDVKKCGPAGTGGCTRDGCPGVGCHFTDKVVVPRGVSCERCSLSWRWDTGYSAGADEATVFSNCADVRITGTGPAPPPRPAPPTPAPAPAPPVGGRWVHKMCTDDDCKQCTSTAAPDAATCVRYNSKYYARGTCGAGGEAIRVTLFPNAYCSGSGTVSTYVSGKCRYNDFGSDEYVCGE